MKKLRYAVVGLLVFLVACYEVNEDIVIDARGSGTYATRMDMSGFVELAKSMASEEDLARNGLDRPIDTIILMKDMIDGSANLTPAQKKVLGAGRMKLVMNLDENVMKADVNFPFDNYAELAMLMSGSGSGGLSDIFKNILAKDSSTTGTSDQPLDNITNVFDVTASNGKIAVDLNRPRFDSLMARPEMGQAKTLAASGLEILKTTTIKLPRPVKKSDNPLITLSADKRTVTLRYDVLKILDTPEKFSYTIEY